MQVTKLLNGARRRADRTQTGRFARSQRSAMCYRAIELTWDFFADHPLPKR